jgi:ABC-type Mn2+/Zn2+ transport system permease subunit
MDWLIDPFRSEFMQYALAAALIVGVTAPAIGVWLVLRRLAYLGDALSHATIGGVGLAYLLGIPLLIGGLVAGTIMGLLMAVLERHRRLGGDAIVGTVETGLFAVGLIILSRNGTGVELSHFLFGQITTVTGSELAVDLFLGAAVLGALWFTRLDLKMATFDQRHGTSVGVNVSALRLMLMVTLTAAVVVSLSTVGVLMSIALLIIPPATARLLTERVSTMTAVAVADGVVVSVAGLIVSYHLGTPPGATIALVACALFAAAFSATVPRRVRHKQEPNPSPDQAQDAQLFRKVATAISPVPDSDA